MKEQPIIEYYLFGTCVRFLQSARANVKIHGESFYVENIERFLHQLEILSLQVTLRSQAVYDLRAFGQELKVSTDKEAVLSEEQASVLWEIMTDIRKTLDAEIAGYNAFLVTPKILDTTKLLYNVSTLFAPDMFTALPEIAQYDFTEAGKCIAFERSTAAAFHLIRGTESVLRYYYCMLVRQKRIPSPLMWASMINDLRKRSKTKKFVTLYNNLDNIRLSYRNPTQHPEKIYNIQEVQDLLPLCIEVINRMFIILREYQHKSRPQNVELLAVLASEYHDIDELPKQAKIVISPASISLPWLQIALETYGKTVLPVAIPRNEQLEALKRGVVDAILVTNHPFNILRDSIESGEIHLLSCSKPSLKAVVKIFSMEVGLTTLRPNTYKGQLKKIESYASF